MYFNIKKTKVIVGEVDVYILAVKVLYTDNHTNIILLLILNSLSHNQYNPNAMSRHHKGLS